MTNLITGSGVLGYGFNIFGEYGEASVLRPLLDLGRPGGQWTSQAGTVYDVPSNTQVNGLTGAAGTVFTFRSREEFSSHFAAKAGVKGSYGAFSGEFEASFAVETSSQQEYVYALYEEVIQAWSLTLVDWSRDALLPNVKKDPDFADLPNRYTEETKHLFFRFFTKYGTHFVSRVWCGGRMFYSAAVSKSYTSDTTEAGVKLSAEFGGVLAHADAQSDFKVADKQWFENRRAAIRTVGGNTDLVAAIIPEHNVSHHQEFESWTRSVAGTPAPMEFQVTPMTALFSGDQAAAVNAAYQAYANSRLYDEARLDGCVLLLAGRSLIPSVAVPGPSAAEAAVSPGWYVAVIDRTDLDVALLKRYKPQLKAGDGANAPAWLKGCDEMWKQMYADLKGYEGKTQYILAMASYGWWGACFPVPEMVGLMESCGAGSGLVHWRSWSQTEREGWIDYALLGVIGIGPRAGIEGFLHSPESEKSAATATGLLIPASADGGQVRFELVPA